MKKLENLIEEEIRQKMADGSYKMVKGHCSYEFLRRRFNFLLTDFFDTDV